MIAWRTSDVSLFVEPFFRPDPGRFPPRGMFENPSIFSKIVPATVKNREDRLAHARGDLVAGALREGGAGVPFLSALRRGLPPGVPFRSATVEPPCMRGSNPHSGREKHQDLRTGAQHFRAEIERPALAPSLNQRKQASIVLRLTFPGSGYFQENA